MPCCFGLVSHRRWFIRIDRIPVSEPCHASKRVLLAERNRIFKIIATLMRCMIATILSDLDHGHAGKTRPEDQSLHDSSVAVPTCTGFSEAQKARLITMMAGASLSSCAHSRNFNLTKGGISTWSAGLAV